MVQTWSFLKQNILQIQVFIKHMMKKFIPNILIINLDLMKSYMLLLGEGMINILFLVMNNHIELQEPIA